MIQIRYGICRPILGIHIRIPPKASHERGNSAGQACIRVILRSMRSSDKTLSRGQWALRRQCVYPRL